MMTSIRNTTFLGGQAVIRVIVLLVAASTSAVAAPGQRPYVLFILGDDLGWSEVGYNGSDLYETPNIARLSPQGMVLTDFYSGEPVCSAKRASIMTGKYTPRTEVTTYLLSPQRDPKHVTPHLPLEELTIAEVFQKHG